MKYKDYNEIMFYQFKQWFDRIMNIKTYGDFFAIIHMIYSTSKQIYDRQNEICNLNNINNSQVSHVSNYNENNEILDFCIDQTELSSIDKIEETLDKHDNNDLSEQLSDLSLTKNLKKFVQLLKEEFSTIIWHMIDTKWIVNEKIIEYLKDNDKIHQLKIQRMLDKIRFELMD